MDRSGIDKLLQKIAKGDNTAFEKLYQSTNRGVFAFLYTYLHNYADAEDAMQTTYLKVKRGIASYRAGTNGRAWILQIAKNQALNEIAKKKRYAPFDEAEKIACETPFKESGVMQTLKRVLSEEEQRIVCLHVLWKYKHREIADILDCPTGTVTSKYKRAIEKLKNALKEE